MAGLMAVKSPVPSCATVMTVLADAELEDEVTDAELVDEVTGKELLVLLVETDVVPESVAETESVPEMLLWADTRPKRPRARKQRIEADTWAQAQVQEQYAT